MRVLVAVEDKEFGGAIVDFIASHQWAPEAKLKILHVVELPLVGDQVTALYGNDLQNEILRERVDLGQQLVLWLKQQINKKFQLGPSVETDTSIGTPHEMILQTARDWKADMIVMGSHGRRGVSRFLLGSVSVAVLSQAECSVVIVRLPGGAKNNHANEIVATKVATTTAAI